MARQSVVKPSAPNDPTLVNVRVLPKGAGRVCTGEPDAVFNDETEEWASPTHPRGATFQIGRTIAEELEERGFVEIQP